MSTLTFRSRDISCGHCAGAVLDAVRGIPGVATVSIDIARKSAAVIYSAPADERDIRRVLRQAGYGVETLAA